MQILCPINNPKEVEPLVSAGADEFYCGVLSNEWTSKYTNMASPNRREFHQSNLSSFAALKKVVRKAHSFGRSVYLTLNAFYTEPQYRRILDDYKKAMQIGIDGFIVADIGLLNEIIKQDKDTNVIISTGATVFNSETVEFYRALGAKRVTLPRHLTINEIKDIIKKSKKSQNMGFEIFIMNTRCMNIDGFCTYQHGIGEVKSRFIGRFFKKIRLDSFLSKYYDKYPWIIDKVSSLLLNSTSACCLAYNVTCKNKKNLKTKRISSFFRARNLVNHCGACSLFELNKLNVKSVKIIGREFSTSKKVNDVKFISSCLSYLKKNPSKKSYEEYCRVLYRKIYKNNCSKHCYYI